MAHKYQIDIGAINEDLPKNDDFRLRRRASEMDLGRKSFQQMTPTFGNKRDVGYVSQKSLDFEEMEILRAENSTLKKNMHNSKHKKTAQNENQTIMMLALQKENKELKKQLKRNESAKDVEAALFELKIEQNAKIEEENKLLKRELLALQENAVRGGKSTNEDVQKMKQSYEDKLWELDNLFRRDYSRLEDQCKSLREKLKNTKPLEFREREDLVAKIRSLKQKVNQSFNDRQAMSMKLQRSKHTLDKYVRRMNQYGQKVKKEFLKREQQIADLQAKMKDFTQQNSQLERQTSLFSSSSISDAHETLIKNLEKENLKMLSDNKVLKAENEGLISEFSNSNGTKNTYPKNTDLSGEVFTLKNQLSCQNDLVQILQNSLREQNREQRLHENFMEEQINMLKSI
jgi:hypothetical protein